MRSTRSGKRRNTARRRAVRRPVARSSPVPRRSSAAALRNPPQVSARGAAKDDCARSQTPIIPGGVKAVHSEPMIEISSTDRVFVLTGAGISAESGIPTFRGAGGLWRTIALKKSLPRAPGSAIRGSSGSSIPCAAALPQPRNRIPATSRSPHSKAGCGIVSSSARRTWTIFHEQAGSRGASTCTANSSRAAATRAELAPFDDTSTYEPARRDSFGCQCGGRIRPHICWFGEVPYRMDEIFQALDDVHSVRRDRYLGRRRARRQLRRARPRADYLRRPRGTSQRPCLHKMFSGKRRRCAAESLSFLGADPSACARLFRLCRRARGSRGGRVQRCRARA